MVTLRKYAPSDRDAFVELFSDPDVVRYAGDGKPLRVERLEAQFARIFSLYDADAERFIAVVEEDGEFAGHVEIVRREGRPEFELVYFLQRARWGRSLGGQVVDMLLQEARRRNLRFVIATVHPENKASLSILARRGFVYDDALSTVHQCIALRLPL